MSYPYERHAPVRRRSGLRGCLLALTIVIWLLVLGFALVRFWARPRVSDWVEGRVARSIDPQLPSGLPSEDALRRSLEQLPIAAALPSGELRVTEDEANAYLSGYRSRLPGVDDIDVRFVGGEVRATVTVRGLRGTASVRPTVRDGRIVSDSAQLSQPLGSILSIDGLLGALEERVNGELAAQGRRITRIDIADGVAVATIE